MGEVMKPEELKHTPRPWSLLCDEARGPRCLVVDSNGNEIASVNPYRESWNQDAELIAASPEMFRLIQRFATADWIGEAEMNVWRKESRRIMSKFV
jgi:hypothetical protein